MSILGFAVKAADINVGRAQGLRFDPTKITIPVILSFIIKFFFIAAGLAAILYLLLGAFRWITSGGNKENVDKAREQIQAAVIGVILIVVVLAIVVTLEQAVFAGKFCLGLSCDLFIPTLLE